MNARIGVTARRLYAIIACGALVASLVAAPPARAVAPPQLLWEAAFPMGAVARAAVYVEARFFDPHTGWHRVESWRRGNQFLHRKTDERLDFYARAEASAGGYEYRLLDHQRRAVFHVDQANLYRIGMFSDWFGLAHMLERPAGSLELRASAPLADEHVPGCQWIEMRERSAPRERRTRICWAAAFGVPLRIRRQAADQRFHDQFRVDAVRQVTAADSRKWNFPTPPAGYVSFDANQAIAPQSID